MSTHQRLLSLVLIITFAGASSLAAQDLAINNVRIIVGTGQVIEQGTIVIRVGRIYRDDSRARHELREVVVCRLAGL